MTSRKPATDTLLCMIAAALSALSIWCHGVPELPHLDLRLPDAANDYLSPSSPSHALLGLYIGGISGLCALLSGLGMYGAFAFRTAWWRRAAALACVIGIVGAASWICWISVHHP